MFNRYVYTALLLLICGTVTSADWTAWKLSRGRQKKKSSGQVLHHLKDASGNTFTLLADRAVDDAVVRKTAETVRILYGWQKLKLRALRLYYINGKFRAIALASSFICGEEDVAPYMPAGMAFFYKEKLSYDFRMVKDNIALKIRGFFSTRSEFALSIASAVKNPLAYASRSNYMARIDELSRRLSVLTYQHHQLQRRFDLALNAILYFRNIGFLRGSRRIKPAVIKRVVQLKRNKPPLTVDQISTILDKEKVRSSSKEIHLILALFFNDYSQ